MLKEAIEKLVALAPATFTKFENRDYADRQVFPVLPPEAKEVGVTTLAGLVDLVSGKLDDLNPAEVLVHVVSPTSVELKARVVDSWSRRRILVGAAVMQTAGFPFGQFVDHEKFIIGLLANFTGDGDREYLAKLASNITNETVRTSVDDGISQEVGVKAGVALKAVETIRNRVTLAPFRTFREVPQPPSEFIFRVKQSGDNIPQLALFEADGGKWQIDAIEQVARYLRAAIPQEIPVVS